MWQYLSSILRRKASSNSRIWHRSLSIYLDNHIVYPLVEIRCPYHVRFLSDTRFASSVVLPGSTSASITTPMSKNLTTSSTQDRDTSTTSSKQHGHMVIIYTCGQCSSRTAKSFSKQAYEQGVVIVTCPGCSAKHLIADNLGWFSDGMHDEKNIEDIARSRGISLQKEGLAMEYSAKDGTFELVCDTH